MLGERPASQGLSPLWDHGGCA